MKTKINLKNVLKILTIIIVLLLVSSLAVYLPWVLFNKKTFGFYVDILMNKTYLLAVAVLFLILLCVVIFQFVKYNLFNFSKTINKVDRAKSDAFGSSKWQSKMEIQKKYGNYSFKNLSNTECEGYVVSSKIKGNDLRFSMVPQQHALIVGTTRTGKSAYVIAMTIQINGQSKTKASMIINDLKGELYENHSLMLKNNGYDVIKIDLRNPHSSHRYNPLSLIYDLYHEYQETKEPQIIDRVSIYINEISAILCPEGQGDNFQWAQGAQSIIKAVLWGLLEDSTESAFDFKKEQFTILQISNIINRQKSELEHFLKHRNKNSPVFDFAGMILDNPSEKTVGSYFSTLSTALQVFLESGLQKITSATDIDISQIGSKPTAVFLIIPDETKSRNIVGTAIISQLYNYLIFGATKNKTGKLDNPVYFLLDEFGNLPKIPNFAQWIALSAGRNIYFNLIIQADSQLESIYGKMDAKTIMQNCHLQMLLGANEIETLKRFEDLFGKYTAYQRSANIDKTQSVEFRGNTSVNGISLITLDKLQRIPMGTSYYKIISEHPCYTTLVPYFEPKISHLIIRGIYNMEVNIKEISKEDTFYDIFKRETLIQSQSENIVFKNPTKPDKSGGDRKEPFEKTRNLYDDDSSNNPVNKAFNFINK